MKKMIVSAFCLGLCLTSVNALAVNHVSNAISVSFLNDDRQVIKQEELPEPVTKALSSDAYKGWSVKEAAIVNTKAADQTQVATSHYEVTLANEKETKIVKFKKDGTLLN